MEGVRNLKNMSAALLIMGLIAAVILTLQISHIYITKQKNRLSIERLLGTVPGVAAGMSLADEIGAEDTEQEKKEDAGQETAEQIRNLDCSVQMEAGFGEFALFRSLGVGALRAVWAFWCEQFFLVFAGNVLG